MSRKTGYSFLFCLKENGKAAPEALSGSIRIPEENSVRTEEYGKRKKSYYGEKAKHEGIMAL
jgi:hypothetical protein